MDPFLGEIAIFPYAGKTVPGWHLCDGTLLFISTNQALYSLIGTTYGGSQAANNFALPDLRGRTPVGFDFRATSYDIGAIGGAETVRLDATTVAAHGHDFAVNDQPGTAVGSNNAIYAQSPMGSPMYAPPPSSGAVTISPDMITSAGGGTSHNNMQPSMALEFYIATTGIYPSRP
ncbi:MAG: tail fiber protein [Rhodospirillales bacterium]|jgi:microcystin-dependent protein|nr:tail fiber protein [Rhodospirillales bacterium]